YKRVDEFVPECVFREIKLKYSKE
ncbi:phosphopantetheine adenylyltransferase, partial [Francisella tularensis subsp. holarctica]|nr:phosphopantetheine adenylyltransferase [Francisella tularensis subsp. holarctica]